MAIDLAEMVTKASNLMKYVEPFCFFLIGALVAVLFLQIGALVALFFVLKGRRRQSGEGIVRVFDSPPAYNDEKSSPIFVVGESHVVDETAKPAVHETAPEKEFDQD